MNVQRTFAVGSVPVHVRRERPIARAIRRACPSILGALVIACALGLPACAASREDDAASASRDDALTAWNASYAELADTRVPKAFDVVTTSVGGFSTSTLPHEAKTLRKQIGELREYVDLFAYAYDKKGPGDPWVVLRTDLDEGYETVGAYKDLFDAQGLTLATKDPQTGAFGEGVRPDQVRYPDTRELEKRRAVVLAWKARFVPRVAAHRAYVSRADPKKMHARDAKEQSQFFWGGANIEPQLDKSGLENLSALGRELLDRAAKDYASISDLGDVTSFDDHEAFHDLRKRVRAIVKIVGYFPELLEPGAAKSLAVAQELVDRYGSLNDRISAYDLASKSEKKKLAAAIEDAWKDVKQWQKESDVGDRLKELKKSLRKRG